MKRLLILLLILVFALAACGGDDDSDSGDAGDDQDTTAQQSSDDADSEDTDDSDATDDDPEDAPPADEPEEEFTLEIPDGYNDLDVLAIPFTNIATGEQFAFASFAGRPILAQGLTLACRPCIETQDIIQNEIIAELGTEDFVFISYSTAFADRPPQFERYLEDNGYDWIFTSADQQFTLELSRTVGDATRNGSAQPRFYIGPNGEVTEVETGPIDAEAAIAQMRELAELAGDTDGDDIADESSDEEMTNDGEATEEASNEEMTDDGEATEEPSEDEAESEATEES